MIKALVKQDLKENMLNNPEQDSVIFALLAMLVSNAC